LDRNANYTDALLKCYERLKNLDEISNFTAMLSMFSQVLTAFLNTLSILENIQSERDTKERIRSIHSAANSVISKHAKTMASDLAKCNENQGGEPERNGIFSLESCCVNFQLGTSQWMLVDASNFSADDQR
jgi:hypothetical protein